MSRDNLRYLIRAFYYLRGMETHVVRCHDTFWDAMRSHDSSVDLMTYAYIS